MSDQRIRDDLLMLRERRSAYWEVSIFGRTHRVTIPGAGPIIRHHLAEHDAGRTIADEDRSEFDEVPIEWEDAIGFQCWDCKDELARRAKAS